MTTPQGNAPNAANSLRQWENDNNVKTTNDEFWKIDKPKMKELQKAQPWKSDPRYFKQVYISALAIIKIVMHAKTGQGKAGIITTDKSNWIEVMGLTHGHFKDHTFVVTDSFALPVEANEVECSLSEAAQLYMIDYCGVSEELGKAEGVVGWYHSHPGYSCYLSGTDVPTQTNNQEYQDPFIALVVDPVRTISTGRVEIKAFRTYPEGYVPDEALNWDSEGIPLSMLEEFGAHAHRYYEVPITIFRSTADAEQLNLLWNKYWMQTLSSSPLSTNRRFTDSRLVQLSSKIEKAESGARQGVHIERTSRRKGGDKKRSQKEAEDPMETVSKSVGMSTSEVMQGLLGMIVKDQIFNGNMVLPPPTAAKKA